MVLCHEHESGQHIYLRAVDIREIANRIDCDPEDADYPISANDDAIRSVRLLLGAVAGAITQARAEFESKKSRRVNEDAAPAEVVPAPAEAAAPVAA